MQSRPTYTKQRHDEAEVLRLPFDITAPSEKAHTHYESFPNPFETDSWIDESSRILNIVTALAITYHAVTIYSI